MPASFDSLVAESVSFELQHNTVVDVYKIASGIHTGHPELTVNDIAEMVAESVVRARGNAVWTKDPLR